MRHSLIAAAALLALAACSDSTGSGKAGPPARLDIVSGDLQPQAVAGSELPQPLVVKVLDAKGKAVEGQLVNWVVTAGGGHLFAGASLTDGNGEARERWTLGTVAGDTQRVEARAVNPTTGQALVFGQFRAFANPGPATQFVAEGAINANAGDVVPAVTLRLTDANGNGIAGAQVTWQVTAGSGTVSSAQTTTDAAGRTSVQWSLGMEVGTQTVRATTAAQTPVQISTVAGTPFGTVGVVSGNQQTGTAGQALAQPVVVDYRRLDGRRVIGVRLRVAPQGGTTSADSVTTGPDGTAQFTWTLPTAAGATSLVVQGSPSNSQSAIVTATAIAGAPVLAVVEAPGPYVGVGRQYAVGVRVADTYGNPILGTTVTGTIQAGGGTAGSAVSGNGGIAYVPWTSGPNGDETQTIRFQAGSATPVDFSVLSKWIWFTLTTAPAPNSVVTGDFTVAGRVMPVEVGMTPDPFSPRMFVTVDGRTQEFFKKPAQGFFGQFSMAGLAPGAKVATFRAVDVNGHEYVQQIPFTYQP
ncbi:MAG TPA: Ig-like domain-containing protein [Longimicrobium sp.]|nr:Ig-like domain-containing protein [Longimicrobium sp.]